MSMKTVIATALGFYDGAMVARGTIFDVPEKLMGRWFEPYVGQVLAEPAALVQEPTTLSELARKQTGAAPIAQVPARVRVKKGGPIAQVPARALTKSVAPAEQSPPSGTSASDQEVI